MGKSHAAGGALAVAVMAPVTSQVLGLGLTPEQLLFGVAIGTLSGVLPDIDHPSSNITKGKLIGAKFFGGIGYAVSWYLSIPPRIIGKFARQVLNHRGGTHSALFMLGWTVLGAPLYALTTLGIVFLLSLVLSALAGVIPALPLINVHEFADWIWKVLPEVTPLIAVSIFWGYFAHLVQDSCTKVPVPWPWPFSHARIWLLPKPFRITTDSHVENLVIRPLIIVLAAAAFALNIGIPLVEQTLNVGGAEAQAIVHTDYRPPMP